MSTLPQTFDRFRTQVEIDPGLVPRITQQQTLLREALQKRWPGSDVFYSGSYGRNTKLAPLQDVDLFVAQQQEFKTPAQISSVMDQVFAVLEEVINGSLRARSRRQCHSVGVFLDGFRLDVVPAYRRKAGGCYIADREQQKWIYTHPRKQAEFTKARDRATGQMAVPLVKLIKAWRRHQHVDLKSFHVEVLVLRCLPSKPESYGAGARLIFEKLAREVMKPCGDPGDSGGRLDEYLDARQRQAVAAAAEHARDQMDRALAAEQRKDYAEATRIVCALFGLR